MEPRLFHTARALAKHEYERSRSSEHPPFESLTKEAYQALCRQQIPAAHAVVEALDTLTEASADTLTHSPMTMWQHDFPGDYPKPVKLCRVCSDERVVRQAESGVNYESWPVGSVLWPCDKVKA